MLQLYFVSYQGIADCYTIVFPALFQGNSSRHNGEVDSCRFGNVLENRLHRIDCTKSRHSSLTNHRVLHCNDKTTSKSTSRKGEVYSSEEGKKIDNKRWVRRRKRILSEQGTEKNSAGRKSKVDLTQKKTMRSKKNNNRTSHLF